MLVYRTICSIPGEDPPQIAENLFSEWLAEKHPELDLPTTGRVRGERAKVWKARADGDGGLTAFQGLLEEEAPDATWTTTMTAARLGPEQWIWVDLARVADDPFARAPVPQPPRIVRRFLERYSCFGGEISVEADVKNIDGDTELLDTELLHEARELPVVVLSTRWGEATASGEEVIDARARNLARALAGIAHVRRLDATATTRLKDRLGDLAVWGGAIRIYRPGMTLDDPPYHHPVLPYQRVRTPEQALRAVQTQISRSAVSRRPPELYSGQIYELPGFPGARQGPADADLVELYDEVEAEAAQTRKDLAAAEVQINDLDDQLELGRLEFDEIESDLRAASSRVQYLERKLAEAGSPAFGEETPDEDQVPQIEGCEEAVEVGAAQLDAVRFCDGAQEAAAGLDADGKAGVWGKKAFRAFRAFQRFAELKAQDPNACADFLGFCQDVDDHPEKVPGNWVAMKESETVTQSPAYSGARTFPVDEAVESSGRVFMEAHIKIQLGKPPAPRIHFYDDTMGSTGKIWVGYFGEHLPSVSTN